MTSSEVFEDGSVVCICVFLRANRVGVKNVFGFQIEKRENYPQNSSDDRKRTAAVEEEIAKKREKVSKSESLRR
jgi:hypothetical protein